MDIRIDELREILTSKNLTMVVKKLGMNRASINNIRWVYKTFCNGDKSRVFNRLPKLYPMFNELRQEGVVRSEIRPVGRGLRKNHIQAQDVVKSHVSSKSANSIDELEEIFTDFKNKLVDVMAKIITDGTKQKIEHAYRKGKTEGAIEVQTQFLTEAKKQNLGNMLKNRLMGN